MTLDPEGLSVSLSAIGSASRKQRRKWAKPINDSMRGNSLIESFRRPLTEKAHGH